uniref:Uncharacterized protein n=2 Tax=Viruses TaxID=10239 RepID=A0A8S5PHI6_9CAUD|nr:MAG TPA: hypothetical protein [Myoviridae sp. ct0jJ30]DAE31795.1 MAG TPA: hypothetical protein [virus sp. ctBM815]DAV23999.1 MAG TPA: hypothetical protein [Bacteriophage sp.]
MILFLISVSAASLAAFSTSTAAFIAFYTPVIFTPVEDTDKKFSDSGSTLT